jgi:hypothetical protein
VQEHHRSQLTCDEKNKRMKKKKLSALLGWNRTRRVANGNYVAEYSLTFADLSDVEVEPSDQMALVLCFGHVVFSYHACSLVHSERQFGQNSAQVWNEGIRGSQDKQFSITDPQD